jgi:hypothetical protein
MTYVVRVIAILFVVPATYFFVFWVPFSLVHLGESHWLIAKLASLMCALAAGWYVWARLDISHDSPVSSMLVGVFVIGGLLVGLLWWHYRRSKNNAA